MENLVESHPSATTTTLSGIIDLNTILVYLNMLIANSLSIGGFGAYDDGRKTPIVQKHDYFSIGEEDAFDFTSPLFVYRILSNDLLRITIIIVALISAMLTYLSLWGIYEITIWWTNLINI